jgi:beta,beta-carotene 9',10'-dioxygenase
LIFLDSFSSLLGGHFPALVVLSVVVDGLRERSFLLVLDAETFAETGRAIAPHVIPFGFHGEFKG